MAVYGDHLTRNMADLVFGWTTKISACSVVYGSSLPEWINAHTESSLRL